MVHGDALITEKLQQTSSEVLLSEVQGSLDQLSAFSPSRKASCRSLGTDEHAEQSSSAGAPSARKVKDTNLSDASSDRLLQSSVRHRRQTASHPLQRSMDWSADKSASDALEAWPQLFQSPNLPGMQPAEPNVAQFLSNDTPAQVWAGMQPELLSQVMQQAQWTSREAVALTGVCRCSIANKHVMQVNTSPFHPCMCSAAAEVLTVYIHPSMLFLTQVSGR